jgi:hypothetical protein
VVWILEVEVEVEVEVEASPRSELRSSVAKHGRAEYVDCA